MKWLTILIAFWRSPPSTPRTVSTGDHHPSRSSPAAPRPSNHCLSAPSAPKAGWKPRSAPNLRGFTGHLDSLAPDLIIKDDIYGRDRLSKDVKRKDVGALAGGDPAAEVQYLWWNSETQGNWRDGFIRSAILAGDPQMLARAKAYVRRILATQDPDGYLGIYDRDLRYRFDGENGELWAKTTLLRGLLAWYEYGGDQKPSWSPSKRRWTDVMRHYPADASHPFSSKITRRRRAVAWTDVHRRTRIPFPAHREACLPGLCVVPL